MKIRVYTFILLSFFSLTACQKSKELLYTDIARIQFGPDPAKIPNVSQATADTLKTQTFVYLPSFIFTDTVFFDIYTMGRLSDRDRPFKIKQVQVKNAKNAIAGKHYKAFDNPEIAALYVIKAGTVHTRVPIVLVRDVSLRDEAYVLKFEVEENDCFRLGQADLLWRKVIFSDLMMRPSIWNEMYSNLYFGTYSEVKHQFMVDVTEQRWDQEFITKILMDTEQLHYWLGMLKSALIEENRGKEVKDHKRDEFGHLIVFP